MLKQAGLAKKTRAHFERAVALDPNHVDAREGLVNYYLQAPAIMGGDVRKAKEQAAAIGRIDPMAGFQQLARIHAHEEDWAAAEAVWKEAVGTFPDKTEPLNGLGFFHQGRKQWNAAFADFEAAQKLDPNDLTSHYQTGRTAVLSGQQPKAAAAGLLAELEALLPDAEALVRWTASLPLPDENQDFVNVALGKAGEYPMYQGRIFSSQGLDIDISEFDSEFEESHVPHSTALHCRHRGQDYLVVPFARINLNLDLLPAATRKLADETGLEFPSANLFHHIVARALEIHVALIDAIRLLRSYQPTDTPYLEAAPRAGVGFGATEAPRGILWHRYELDESGSIVSARIVPPTSQNQARMEADLRSSLNRFGLDQPEQALRRHAETVIRNYDPCISCATHFLRLKLERP